MSADKLKVALVADRPGWVLETIARAWARRLGSEGHSAEILIAPERRGRWHRQLEAMDLVHFLSPWNFVQWATLMPCPAVVSVHHLTAAGDRMIRPRLKHAATVCVANAAMHERLTGVRSIDGWSCPLVRIDYGVDAAEFSLVPASGKSGEPPCRPFVIGFAAKKSSNDEARKGLDRLWSVMRVLDRQGCEVRLRIFGPTGGSDWIPEDVPGDLRRRVEFTGFQERSVYLASLAGVDCYLSLSRVEGGPYPVLEKMATGGVVVSTPVGIVPELVRSGVNGFMVSGDDTDGIVQCLRALIDDPGKAAAMGAVARDDCLRRHEWGAVFARVSPADVYRGALQWDGSVGRRSIVRRWRTKLLGRWVGLWPR